MPGDDEVQDSTADDVGPRQAPGNDGWNEPSAEAPESIERAVRAEDGPGEPDPDEDRD
jgi:hypothetical protein